MARVTFVGKMVKPSNGVEFVTTSKNNSDMLIFNASMVEGTNKEFIKMFGGGNRTIYAKDDDKNKLEIAWDDRFDADILKKVPYWYKTRINVTGEQEEFLSQWDAIKYLEKHFDEFADKRLAVTCDVNKNVYNGNITNQYMIRGIRLAGEKEKDGFEYRTTLYWNKDCIDDTDWEKDHILYVDGYEESYDKDSKTNKFFPQRFVLNCQKINYEDEAQKKAADYRENILRTKSSDYQKLAIECRLVVGAEQKDDWSEDDLTDAQKELVALGLKTVDDLRPRGERFGEYKREIRFICPDYSVRGYEDGAVSADMSTEEFEEKMYYAPADPNDDFVTVPEDIKQDIQDLFK